MQLVLTPELILEAYSHGLFPMAYNSGSPHINWVCPDMRGQLSITGIHIPRSLKQTLRRGLFDVRINTAFENVITACATPAPDRPETWINPAIRDVFIALHQRGHAHSVEAWQNESLVGGVYGLAIGQAFFGESMFSRKSNASKVALIHLVARLWKGGFKLLDTQFVNEHLRQFGVYEIPHEDYIEALHKAVKGKADFRLENLSQNEILTAYFHMRK